MKNDNWHKEVEIEKTFGNTYCDERSYGKYCKLLFYFISSFRDVTIWENEIFPYLYSLENKTGKINDWNSFEWKGQVCFRYNYVMILDETLHQIGRKLPNLFDQSGNQVLNDEGEWLLDTDYIKAHYSEFVIIPISEIILVCQKWLEILRLKK